MFGKGHHDVPECRLQVLRQLPMFDSFTDQELAAVDPLLYQLSVAPGGTLTRQGKTGREAFIVISGRAEVHVDGHLVAYAGAGDVIGEMALLDHQPRCASVVAASPLEVFVVDPGEFAELFGDPRLARWIASRLTERLRQREYTDHLVSAAG